MIKKSNNTISMALISKQILEKICEVSNHNLSNKCGDTSDFTSACLSHNWNTLEIELNSTNMKKWYHSGWVIKEYNRLPYMSDINIMYEIILNTGFINIELDIYHLEHAFNICNTVDGIVVIDSYINCRPLGFG